jgi:CRP-like cAMP-binding protein
MNLVERLIEKIEEQGLWEKTLELERNEFLKVQGSKDTNLYLILSGSLRMFFVDEFEEHTIRFGYKNNFIAALDSFITDKPSDLYIQALKKTELKVISKGRFTDFIDSSAENTRTWQTILQELIYQQMEREKDILTYSPIERYRRVLNRSPRLFQEIPNKYIASYLRMTPETLSRIKKS